MRRSRMWLPISNRPPAPRSGWRPVWPPCALPARSRSIATPAGHSATLLRCLGCRWPVTEIYGCCVLRAMRIRASGFVAPLLVGSAACAAAPRPALDLPAGPLSAAVTALAEHDGISIGTSDPRLLAIMLPPLHLRGSTAAMLGQLAR